ncbi:16S rRNA (guanine(966)-N(2))-methyltransferase RsmD [Lachnospiraceae bacterium JLR.KK008]
MRVIAGSARSLPLKTPPGLDTRPTTDRIKETLFNILQPHLSGSVFLDLFSGSGGIGIEALSRGAERAYFVEKDRRAAACIEDNLRFTKLSGRAVILQEEVQGALSRIREEAVDLIFMDPPYGKGLERQTLTLLESRTYVTRDTLIVVESALETDFSDQELEHCGFMVEREKKYKTNKHVFIRRRA